MTSLDWPPYSGENLEENGLSIAIARDAFAAMGYELVVEFKPWVRTVTLASKKDKYIGYFPEYEFDTEEFVFSNAIGSSPLGFVELSSAKVSWNSLDDLIPLRIGVVQGYVNTTEFDHMVEQGMLSVEATTNDVRNIYKVAKGRLPLAVIDQNVLEYLIRVDPRKDILAKRVNFNARPLEHKKVVVAFRNTVEGRQWRDIFNLGLKRIDVSSIASRLSHPDHLHQAVNLNQMLKHLD